jgi:poly-gamma-glutamate synthesis protein (capsule biosynthesis protein)
MLRGIEVHAGVPIFYSLGSFIFQNDTILRHPDDARRASGLQPDAHDSTIDETKFDFTTDPRFWRTAVALVDLDPAKGTRVELQPFILSQEEYLLGRGLPTVPAADDARPIVEELATLSSEWATELSVTDTYVQIALPA